MLNKQNSGVAANINYVLRVTDQVALKAVCSDNRLTEASQVFSINHMHLPHYMSSNKIRSDIAQAGLHL